MIQQAVLDTLKTLPDLFDTDTLEDLSVQQLFELARLVAAQQGLITVVNPLPGLFSAFRTEIQGFPSAVREAVNSPALQQAIANLGLEFDQLSAQILEGIKFQAATAALQGLRADYGVFTNRLTSAVNFSRDAQVNELRNLAATVRGNTSGGAATANDIRNQTALLESAIVRSGQGIQSAVWNAARPMQELYEMHNTMRRVQFFQTATAENTQRTASINSGGFTRVENAVRIYSGGGGGTVG